MKKIHPMAAAILILSLILAVGVLTFLRPCVHEDGSAAPCSGMKTVLPVLGAAGAVSGLLLLFLRRPAARMILSAAAVCSGILAAVAPGRLTGICRMSSMRCLTVTSPAALVLGVLIAVCGLISLCAEIPALRKIGGRK